MFNYNKLITNAFYDLFNDIYLYIENQKLNSIYPKIFIPDKFKEELINKHIQFKTGQHDAIELFRILLNDLISENNLNKNIIQYKLFDNKGKSKIEQSIEYDEFLKKRENCFIIETFYTQLINIYRCECGSESYSFQKILDIPLLLPIGNDVYHLKSIIKNNFKDNIYDWKDICNGCKRNYIMHSKEIY